MKRIDKYVEYEKEIVEEPPLSAVSVKIIIFDKEIKRIALEKKEKEEEEERRKKKERDGVQEEEEEEDEDEDEEEK